MEDKKPKATLTSNPSPSLEITPDVLNKIKKNVDENTPEEQQHSANELSENEKVELVGKIQDMEERKKYAELIFTLVAVWLFIVLMIVCHQGKLSDNVLITLLSTTTVKILGLFYFVARYLFQPRYPSNDTIP